ncbi:peptidase M1 [Flavobacterium sp. 316]|uniref:M1 family metallopeptidase n=1 Tax=Flavobacterium sediminilitoris TaxID=2024526 RepID=A0ABY4HJH4_9FLAO|nr:MULTISPECIES: M1 family metallopeptidase [Flavobacterium]KIX22358.1 peptidase M1 [Flavobacterium sp. 316]UOX32660.1 M1 family metallopeptidase [Flavobacterium sediminilitoris]
MKKTLLLSILALSLQQLSAQNFTRRDSLHGGLRFERNCFDVQHYDLNIKINPDERSIVGYNDITFNVVEPTSKIQLDLFDNMHVDSIVWNDQKLKYERDYDAVFISFPKELAKDTNDKVRFYYSGKPKVAKNAPWDGGFVFKKDSNDKHFVAVAVQGTGASLWYPVKDSQTDEPNNGATIKVAVPNGLMNVSNGRFKGSEDLKNGYTRWNWEVKNPINNYTITVNIADYVHIEDKMDNLDLDYYVLRENEEKAKNHFDADVKPMMECFQAKFGRYPFWEDGYKLVETPYLGMEHQSAVAYGNKYRKGYLGRDLSGTGEGMNFDFIIIHETGHEWFGNSVTSKDIADMWIHESFTTYSETVFVECMKGYDAAMKYINGQSQNVQNDKPIIGQYGVNNEGSGDMYYKGALLLNTLRHVVNNDEKWWDIILKYSETFRKQIIDTKTVVDFFNKETGRNLTPIFEQYLQYTTIPKLEFKKYKKRFQYRWITNVPNFEMPVDIMIEGKKMRLDATNEWQKSKEVIPNLNDIEVLTNHFFIKVNQ